MRVALAAIAIAVIGMGPGIAKYAGPPPPDPIVKKEAPVQLIAAEPWTPPPKPAGVAGLIARLRALS